MLMPARIDAPATDQNVRVAGHGLAQRQVGAPVPSSTTLTRSSGLHDEGHQPDETGQRQQYRDRAGPRVSTNAIASRCAANFR